MPITINNEGRRVAGPGPAGYAQRADIRTRVHDCIADCGTQQQRSSDHAPSHGHRNADVYSL